MADPAKNFAIANVSTGYDASATSIVLSTGGAARFPDPGTDGAFNVVWWNSSDYDNPSDDPNREIVRVTGIASETLTITRAQEGTSASTKNAAGKTYKIALVFSKKVYDDLVASIAAAQADVDAIDVSTMVTASSTFATDNRLLRSDGTGRGAQSSGVELDDNGNMTIASNRSLSTGDIVLTKTASEGNGHIRYDGGGAAVTNGAYFSGANNSVIFAVYLGDTNRFTIDDANNRIGFGWNAVPLTSDGAALGTTSLMWSDLFLASGGVLNFNNGDVTVTHSANTLAFAGATSGYTFDDTIFVTGSADEPALQLTNNSVSNSQIFGIIGPASTGLNDGKGFSITVNGEGFARVMFYTDGKFGMGSGSATRDVILSRSAANVFRVSSDGGTGSATLESNTFRPIANDGGALGSATLSFADLFLASGAVINFNNGNFTITHSAGLLTMNGPLTAARFIPNSSTTPSNGIYLPAANTLGFAANSAGQVQLTDGFLSPMTNDDVALGTTSLQWSDLFLAEGGVINWDNGDVTITQTGNTLAFAGASSAYTFDSLVLINGATAISTNPLVVKVLTAGDGFIVTGDGTNAPQFSLYNGSTQRGAYGLALASGHYSNIAVAGDIVARANGGTDGRFIITTQNSNGSAIIFATGTSGANDTGRVQITHAGVMSPYTNDGAVLGSGTLMWSDLFLASGGVINFNNGNATITHSAGLLTISTATRALTLSAGKAASGFRRIDILVDATYTQGIGAEATNSTDPVLGSYVTGDSHLRFNFQASGLMEWGPGNGVVDTNLYRSAANTLKTDDALIVTGALTSAANDGSALGSSSIGWADLFLATGGNILVNNANAKRTLVLSAAGGNPTTTAGCAAVAKVEAGTNDVDYWVLDFDTTTEERAFWVVAMPDNWDGGTLTARFYWTNASGSSTQTVDWGIKARAFADDAAIDQAYGTEITTTDTWLAQGDVHISAESSAITVAGSPAGGQLVIFNVGRKTATDNMTGDARLMMVKIEYGINAYSD